MPRKRTGFFTSSTARKKPRTQSRTEPMQDVLTVDEWYGATLISAKRRNSKAQLQFAYYGFRDFDALESILQQPVDFTDSYNTEPDYPFAFDWLDLAVHFKNKTAIGYFQRRLNEKEFSEAYLDYKRRIRPYCDLKKWEVAATDKAPEEEPQTSRAKNTR